MARGEHATVGGAAVKSKWRRPMRSFLHWMHAFFGGFHFGICPRCRRRFSAGLSRGRDYGDEELNFYFMTCCPGDSLRGRPIAVVHHA